MLLSLTIISSNYPVFNSISSTMKFQTCCHANTGEKPYSCNHCEKAFTDKSMLTKHVRIHTGEKPYLCKFCEKKFSCASTKSIHELSHFGQ